MVVKSNDVEYLDGKVFKIFFPGGIEEAVINAIKKGNIWEKKLLKHYKNFIKKGDVVLDIGAYLGTHSLSFSQLAGTQGKVFSFEPQHTIFGLLKKTVKENKIKNIKLINKAVYSKNGTVLFSNTETGKASITHVRSRLKSDDKRKVKTLTVDSLKLKKCNFMKIDVEKGEWHVLEGASQTIRKHRPVIFLETFKTPSNFKKLNDFLKTYKYTSKNIGGADFVLEPKKAKKTKKLIK